MTVASAATIVSASVQDSARLLTGDMTVCSWDEPKIKASVNLLPFYDNHAHIYGFVTIAGDTFDLADPRDGRSTLGSDPTSKDRS